MNKEVYKEMCSQIYEGESWDRMINCLERKDKEIEELNNRIENAKHFIDQVLGYHLSSGYEQLDKDVNELYGILMGVDKE